MCQRALAGARCAAPFRRRQSACAARTARLPPMPARASRAPPTRAGDRQGFRRAHPPRLPLRQEIDRGRDLAAPGLRAEARRLPGFLAPDDRRPARHRHSRRLCQRLPAHHPAARCRAPGGRRRHARLGARLVRPRGRLDRLRPDQPHLRRREPHRRRRRPRLSGRLADCRDSPDLRLAEAQPESRCGAGRWAGAEP